MSERTTMLRASIGLLEAYRKKNPNLKGLSYTAINEVMLREALEPLSFDNIKKVLETLEKVRAKLKATKSRLPEFNAWSLDNQVKEIKEWLAKEEVK